MITRENYEISFLDYSEGKLSEKETTDLLVFLERNPDLKEEFDLFENITLIPDNLDYEDKLILKEIPDNNLFDLTQLEYLCIAKSEGDLIEDEKDAINELLKNNLNNEEDELMIISLLKLKPDRKIKFRPKFSLKRNPVFSILTQGLSFAAAIFAFIFILNQAAIYNTEVDSERFAVNNYYTKIKDIKNNEELVQVQENKIHTSYKKDTFKIVNTTIVEPDNKDSLPPETVITEFKELVIPRAEGVFFASNDDIDFSELDDMNDMVMAMNIAPPEKRRFWRIAEKTVKVWKRITSSETELKNKYNAKGELVEFCLNTENIEIRKKVKSR